MPGGPVIPERKKMKINCTGRIQDGIYNCFGEYDNSMCYDCIYNLNSEKKRKVNRFINYRDKIDEFYKFLKGEELPEGMSIKTPKLSPDLAFTVIWFLQEHLQVLPDNIEQCDGCKELFDTESSGCHLDDNYVNTNTGKIIAKKHQGNWCDGCVPPIEYEL